MTRAIFRGAMPTDPAIQKPRNLYVAIQDVGGHIIISITCRDILKIVVIHCSEDNLSEPQVNVVGGCQ